MPTKKLNKKLLYESAEEDIAVSGVIQGLFADATSLYSYLDSVLANYTFDSETTSILTDIKSDLAVTVGKLLGCSAEKIATDSNDKSGVEQGQDAAAATYSSTLPETRGHSSEELVDESFISELKADIDAIISGNDTRNSTASKKGRVSHSHATSRVREGLGLAKDVVVENPNYWNQNDHGAIEAKQIGSRLEELSQAIKDNDISYLLDCYGKENEYDKFVLSDSFKAILEEISKNLENICGKLDYCTGETKAYYNANRETSSDYESGWKAAEATLGGENLATSVETQAEGEESDTPSIDKPVEAKESKKNSSHKSSLQESVIGQQYITINSGKEAHLDELSEAKKKKKRYSRAFTGVPSKFNTALLHNCGKGNCGKGTPSETSPSAEGGAVSGSASAGAGLGESAISKDKKGTVLSAQTRKHSLRESSNI